MCQQTPELRHVSSTSFLVIQLTMTSSHRGANATQPGSRLAREPAFEM